MKGSKGRGGAGEGKAGAEGGRAGCRVGQRLGQGPKRQSLRLDLGACNLLKGYAQKKSCKEDSSRKAKRKSKQGCGLGQRLALP